MGTAILERVRKNFKVLVCEQNPQRANYLRRTYKITPADFGSALKKSDIVIVAVKPQDIEGVLECMSALVRKKLVISIAAGITTSYIEKRLGNGTKVIRTMPNLNAQIGQGVTAICKGKYAAPADVRLARDIFNKIGTTVIVQEKNMDAVTAISGSGPAYVFLFEESLQKAAESLGLDKATAKILSYGTLLGSVFHLLGSKDDAQTLRAKVTSKGGTTEAAMKVFFAKKFQNIIKEAAMAAKKRAGKLSKK